MANVIRYTLKPGDLVNLKSGGPKMTVMEIDEIAALGVGAKPVEAYRCEWFTPRDILKSKSFPIAALEKYALPKKEL